MAPAIKEVCTFSLDHVHTSPGGRPIDYPMSVNNVHMYAVFVMPEYMQNIQNIHMDVKHFLAHNVMFENLRHTTFYLFFHFANVFFYLLFLLF